MNINDIFGTRKLTKREKREQRLREIERNRSKIELVKFNGPIHDKKSKQKIVKMYEKNPAFQNDLRRMKEMLIKPQLKPINNIVDDKYNVMKPQKGFFKSNTKMEMKGFDKQFKKDMMRL